MQCRTFLHVLALLAYPPGWLLTSMNSKTSLINGYKNVALMLVPALSFLTPICSLKLVFRAHWTLYKNFSVREQLMSQEKSIPFSLNALVTYINLINLVSAWHILVLTFTSEDHQFSQAFYLWEVSFRSCALDLQPHKWSIHTDIDDITDWEVLFHMAMHWRLDSESVRGFEPFQETASLVSLLCESNSHFKQHPQPKRTSRLMT